MTQHQNNENNGNNRTSEQPQAEFLFNLAYCDELTGLLNRKFFQRVLKPRYAATPNAELGMLYIDIDNFKQYNDTRGHRAGDTVLASVADALRKALDEQGFPVVRYGGEEFVAVLPGCNGQLSAWAELVRWAVAQQTGIRVSIGAAKRKPGESIERLIARADEALLQAKARGKNCVVGS